MENLHKIKNITYQKNKLIISLENHTFPINCNYNHLFISEDGNYKSAKNLIPGNMISITQSISPGK